MRFSYKGRLVFSQPYVCWSLCLDSYWRRSELLQAPTVRLGTDMLIANILVMVALCTLYFHPVISFFFLSFFFSAPNLSGRRLDVYHTSTHGVALVRI